MMVLQYIITNVLNSLASIISPKEIHVYPIKLTVGVIIEVWLFFLLIISTIKFMDWLPVGQCWELFCVHLQ